MQTFDAHDVEDAFNSILPRFRFIDVLESRYGNCIDLGEPLAITYVNPTRRVLFNSDRDANPFFHLMEALWMLTGRRDVEWIAEFNSNMKQFSDDGEHYHGAYGFRWRVHFGLDQVAAAIYQLIDDPMTRRVVISMYDANVDTDYEGKDMPCNMEITLNRRRGPLDMCVFNRSNDVIWGLLGSNVVHFSMLQEYIAAFVGCDIGTYTHVTSNPHVYTKTYRDFEVGLSPYTHGTDVCPMVDDPRMWLGDALAFTTDQHHVYHNRFFSRVAEPMRHAWRTWKAGNKQQAVDMLRYRYEEDHFDWLLAGAQWMERRL